MQRPPASVRVTIGLEKVLCRAAGDAAFRAALLRDRLAAVDAAGWVLQPSEAAALSSVPDAVLSSMITHIDLKRHTQRRFGRAVATAAFASAALTASVDACGGGSLGHEDDFPMPDIAPAQETVVGNDAVVPVDEGPASRGNEPDTSWEPPEEFAE